MEVEPLRILRSTVNGGEVKEMGKKSDGSQKTSTHVCTHPFEQLRRKDAEGRKEERNKRSPEDQLKLLDDRLGVGIGAKKERTRLQKLIDDDN